MPSSIPGCVMTDMALDTPVRGRSPWQDARRRLFANRAAVASPVILAAMALVCIFGPMFLPWTYDQIDWDHMEVLPPNLELGHYLGTDSVG